MSTLLMIGSAVGVIIGLVHGCYVYVQRTKEDPKKLAEHPVRVRINAVYFALWTLVLWTAFGSYVFNLWLISVVIYSAYKGIKRFPIPRSKKASQSFSVEARSWN